MFPGGLINLVSFTAFSYHYLIAGCLNIVILTVFFALLFRNFLKKRTVGTFLLILSYGSILAYEVLATAAFFHEGLYPGDANASAIAKMLHIIGVFCLVYTINWIYFFGNRHLIRDNDLFKSLYTSFFGGFIGVIGGLAFQDIILGREVWYSTIELAGADFNLYIPSIEWPQIILIIGLFGIGSITYFRLIIRTFQLQRKAKDIVTKKGLRVVSISIFLLLLTGMTLGAYIFGANEIAIVSALLYVLRGIIVIAAVATGYIGWIMPEWVRKRFRGKSWIAKVYTGKIPEPKKKQTTIEGQSDRFVEVSDV